MMTAPYVFTVKSDRIEFPIIIKFWLFRNYSQTKVKEERRNLTINRKNYRNALRGSYCYYVNGKGC